MNANDYRNPATWAVNGSEAKLLRRVFEDRCEGRPIVTVNDGERLAVASLLAREWPMLFVTRWGNVGITGRGITWAAWDKAARAAKDGAA